MHPILCSLRPKDLKDGAEFPMTTLTNRFADALNYCFLIHRNQYRKGKPTPYIAHLLSVSALVLEDGGDEDEAIAALLHDSLEDQPDKTSPEEISQRFGDRVYHLILSCTDTPSDYRGGPKPPWKQRKEKYLEHIRNGADGALRITLADKVHNLTELIVDYHQQGESLWQRFNAGKSDQVWLYHSLVSAFEQGGAAGPMFGKFKHLVSDFELLMD